MGRHIVFLVFCLAAPAQTTLTLAEAVADSLAAHPALAAGTERAAAASALRAHAARRLNPSFNYQAENLRGWGTPSFKYGETADTFAFLSQTIETSGKRRHRTEVAAAEERRATLERELLARQIATRVKFAYWRAAGAQRLRELLAEHARTFSHIVAYHEIRVREGAMAEADLIRVTLESDRFALDLNSAILEAERSRVALLSEMGRPEFAEVRLVDSLEPPDTPPLAVDVERALEQRTELKIARQAIDRARAGLGLRKAEASPDVELSFGYKRTEGFNALMGGVGIPLPLFQRNQDAISAAQAEVRAAERDLAAAEILVRAEVAAARADYEIRRRQIGQSLRPLRQRAEETARIALAAYREGGTDLLRLLDAERVRLDAQSVYYRTLVEYQQSVAALEAALGVAQ